MSPKACSKHCGKPWFSRPRLADCCAILSFRSPYALATATSLRRRGRSSVDAAFDQQSPDDAGHLVGQGHGDQHLRLAWSASAPATTRLAPHAGRPVGPRRWPRGSASGGWFARPASTRRRASACRRSISAAASARARRRSRARSGSLSAAGTSAVIAVAAIGPTPGIVISRRATGSAFERRLISASSSVICASSAAKVSISSLRIDPRTFGQRWTADLRHERSGLQRA